MKPMRKFWIFGYQWWGGLRPAKCWSPDGRIYYPLAFGIWIQFGRTR